MSDQYAGGPRKRLGSLAIHGGHTSEHRVQHKEEMWDLIVVS